MIMITSVLYGLFLIGYTSAQGVGYVGTGVGPGFGYMQPFPNMMPPFMMPQIPMPYMPMMVPNPGVSTGGAVVSRSNFGSDGGSTTYISANPYGGYTYTSGGSTYTHPSQGQTVLDSRFSENDGSESHTVHTSHTSSFSSPNSGSSTHRVYTQTSHGTPTPYSSSSNGGDANTEVRPILTSRGGAAQTSIGHSSSNNGGSAHTEYKPSTSYSGGGSQTAYAPAYPSSVGTSSFTSSTNVNGQQETVSSINNNGYVQTYRQSSGK